MLPCKQRAAGASPVSSTYFRVICNRDVSETDLPITDCSQFGGLASLDAPVVRQGKGKFVRPFRLGLRIEDSQANPVL